MCHKNKVISRVKEGELSICISSKTYNLTFKNIFFQFKLEELIQFKRFILNVDTEYWLDYFSNSTQKRKIPIPTFHQNLILFFDIYEIGELKKLLKIHKKFKKAVLSPGDVDYVLILN